MSTPQDITVSLDWARKLDKCGFRGYSYWLWAYHCIDLPAESEFQEPQVISKDMEDHYHQWEMYLAPTWADIFREIPEIRWYEVTLDAEFCNSWNPAIYENVPTDRKFQSRRELRFKPREQSPHDDVSAMYVYLSDNGLLPRP